MENMTSIKQVSLLVAVLAMTLAMVSFASASGQITSVEVGDIVVGDNTVVGSFAGDTIPVRVFFSADDNAHDVRVKAWIAGQKEIAAVTERFDVIGNVSYSRTLSVQLPDNLKELDDSYVLNVVVESKDGVLAEEAEKRISLSVQRDSYKVEVLDAYMNTKVEAGDNLAVDIVLKNRGRYSAEDNFVVVSIPELGIQQRAYFGDLVPKDDQADSDCCDGDDAVERRMVVRIPSDAKTDVYDVEVQAFNSDSVATVTKKVAVVAASDENMLVSSTSSKTFAIGEDGVYTMTLVNSGNKIKVYELVIDAPEDMKVSVDEPIVAVPAGSSKTVKLTASSDKAGKYDFKVDVRSDNKLVESKSFSAKIEGTKTLTASNNATVLLTVVLAIIFVVLLVVLIVLLTRKPQKTEEFGESYY